MADIFSEVEEDVRKERWEQLWKRYGTFVIAAAMMVVASVAGWQVWERYDLSQRQSASLAFNNAINVAEAGNLPQAESEFIRLASEAPAGYARLAEFLDVKTQLAQGKRDEAVTSLRELVADSNPLLSAPARLQLAWVLAETAPRDEVEAIIAPLQDGESPWRFAAAEVSAYLNLHHGDRAEAAAAYQALALDPGAAEGLQQRAGTIAQFLRANATPATNATAPIETEISGGEAVPLEATPESDGETNDQEAP